MRRKGGLAFKRGPFRVSCQGPEQASAAGGRYITLPTHGVADKASPVAHRYGGVGNTADPTVGSRSEWPGHHGAGGGSQARIKRVAPEHLVGSAVLRVPAIGTQFST
jgi:hypothetical protein